MKENISKMLTAGYPVSYIFGALSKAAARVAKGQGTDGNCSDLECELHGELQKFVPSFLVVFHREGREPWDGDAFPTLEKARDHAAFCTREDRYGTLKSQIFRLQCGEREEVF